ncbi:MAG: glycosyltransferase [Gammaproteobacteria bacterium]|nr:glycosyltransferase [Gammaproteobacteria bacterium]
MKSVMFVVPSLGGGGAERVVLTLLKHLDRTQFSLSLVVINTRRSVHLSEVPRDVELIDFGSRRVRAALLKLLRLIRRRRPDVVFSTQGYLNLGMALIKPWLPAATRCVARETSIVSKLLHLHRRPAVLRFLYRRVYQRLDTVVCQSRAMRDDLVTAYGFPADKTVIIHNPVDVEWVRARAREQLDLIGLKPGHVNLVTAGRLSPEKGLDIVIAALALCRMPNLNLVILGEGKLRAALEALALKLGVRGQVQFAGFQTNPYPWFAHADLFVLGSRSEGFPNVALEALACGTPLVATPCDSLRDLGIGASEGLLARDFTPQALADAIQQVVAERADFSISVERVRAKFGISTIACQYRDLLRGSGREQTTAE